MENDIFPSPSTPSKNFSVHKATSAGFFHWSILFSILVLMFRFAGETGLMVCLGEQEELLTRLLPH